METWLVLLHAISLNLTIMTIISVLIQLCLTISLGIQNTACLTNLFSGCSCCVETGHLIGAYRLAGFFTVGMTTDRVFRAGYTISSFVSLALSLLDFFNFYIFGLSGIFHKMFFRYSGLWFSSEQGFSQFCPSWPWGDVHWCRFMVTMAVLEHPSVYWKFLHFQRCWLIWSNIMGAVWSFNNRHSACELKYRNLSLRSHCHNNIFAYCFFFRNSDFLFVLFLTVFLVIKHNACNGTKNSKALSFLLSSQKCR